MSQLKINLSGLFVVDNGYIARSLAIGIDLGDIAASQVMIMLDGSRGRRSRHVDVLESHVEVEKTRLQSKGKKSK